MVLLMLLAPVVLLLQQHAAMATYAAAPTAAAAVARSTQTLPADMPVDEALRSVRVRPATAMSATQVRCPIPSQPIPTLPITPNLIPINPNQLLAELGVHSRLDLQLLGGGPEATELIESLSGSLSLGDRSKIRLLVGDRVHLARVAAVEEPQR
eukprot:SAG31_NODE_18892_length_619_cov_0.907692_1_plen_153_part_01